MDFDYLYIYIDDIKLKEQYQIFVDNHNKQVKTQYPNAGFDLLTPFEINENNNFILDTNIKCCMTSYNNENLSYYLYPRSSIIKTPFRLANSVGIIDSGYRGNIKAVFDSINTNINFNLPIYSRLVQICSPTLKPLIVEIIDDYKNLGLTERGLGGFGSTGV